MARARDARRKILVLGSINTLFLVVIVAATGKPAPPISLLVLVAGLALALIGSHGVARDLGARVLGHDEPAVPGADAKEVAVGWFVMVFSAALPLVGLFLAIYWLVASVGVAAMLLLVGPPTGDAPDPTGEAPDPTGDGPAGDASPTGDAG